MANDFDAEVRKLDREADLARDLGVLRNKMHRLTNENKELRKAVGLIDAVLYQKPRPPKWLTPKKPKAHHATALYLFSDNHFDEVVQASEMRGLNEYNRDIATERLKAWSANAVSYPRDYLTALTWDGAVVALLGDTFSGDIHEELQQTNADTLPGSLLYWSEQICAALERLASFHGKVYVCATPGNHGRMSRKPRMKLRARTNFDWLLAKLVERNFKGDSRFTFDVPESADTTFDIYSTKFYATHGDAAHGGNGIGGIWPPIMRLRAKKHQTESFDCMILGHWHQYTPTRRLIVNGAMKGFDEYAFINGFEFEPPCQAFVVVTPERGITHQAPIWCD